MNSNNSSHELFVLDANAPNDPGQQPFVFLGIAEHLVVDQIGFPVGKQSVFDLSHVKPHYVFPIPLDSYYWLFLVNMQYLYEKNIQQFELIVENLDGEAKVTSNNEFKFAIGKPEQAETEMQNDAVESKKRIDDPDFQGAHFFDSRVSIWSMYIFSLKGMLEEPGEYFVFVRHSDQKQLIGKLLFNYVKRRAFTEEEELAIRSNPALAKQIRIRIGCKQCDDHLLVYAGLARSRKTEEEGAVWYQDVGEKFSCRCGRTSQSLKYVRENLHALLEYSQQLNNISFERRYAHNNVVNMITRFNQTLDKKDVVEEDVQKFIKENPILLSSLNPKSIHVKSPILNKYRTDFTILDSQNNLILVELENPNMKLFTQKGNPTAPLTAAYGQINDWMIEINNHRSAVFSSLGLKTEDVRSVRGFLVAGRSKNEKEAHLQKHMMRKPYSEINLFTFDDLANATATISRQLA